MKMKSIKWLLISVCFITTTTLSLTTYAITPLEWRVILHFSGKQRMLTQKMCKEILFIAQDIHVEQNKQNLQKSATLFAWTLKGLRDGDKRLRLVKTSHSGIKQQLDTVAYQWDIFRGYVDAVILGDISSPLLENVAVQNIPLLNNMDTAVKMYEQESGLSLKPEDARTLNLVGKQRMLTQKMTKELLLIANGIAPKENQTKLRQTMYQFEQTLMGLLNGDERLGLSGTRNSAIRSQLRKTHKLWKKYKRLLNKSTFSRKDLLKVERLNMPLLKAMDNTVKMYVIFLK